MRFRPMLRPDLLQWGNAATPIKGMSIRAPASETHPPVVFVLLGGSGHLSSMTIS
jgi:hypothetical protein